MPSLNENVLSYRGTRVKRMLVPNLNVCDPLIQLKSSTKFCVGVLRPKVAVSAS